MRIFNLLDIELIKYFFFIGKGGVGKIFIVCVIVVGLVDNGKKIFFISIVSVLNL